MKQYINDGWDGFRRMLDRKGMNEEGLNIWANDKEVITLSGLRSDKVIEYEITSGGFWTLPRWRSTLAARRAAGIM